MTAATIDSESNGVFNISETEGPAWGVISVGPGKDINQCGFIVSSWKGGRVWVESLAEAWEYFAERELVLSDAFRADTEKRIRMFLA